jgi:hypothetical protein
MSVKALITDSATNQNAVVKGAEEEITTTDNALVVGISPNTSVRVGATGHSAYAPDPSRLKDGMGIIAVTPSRALETHSTVLTDEGSFRDDFSGSSLLHNLTGQIEVVQNTIIIQGFGTRFKEEIYPDHYIKISTHDDAHWAHVEEVIDNTTLELSAPYTGPTAKGSPHCSSFASRVPTGSTQTVVSSLLTFTNTTTSGHQNLLYHYADYLPCALTVVGSISQRIVNQSIVIGFVDNKFTNLTATPNASAVFIFSGTNNQEVICQSSFASDSIQSTTITYPGTLNSSQTLSYEINVTPLEVLFIINETIVASHRNHIPNLYTPLSIVTYVKNNATTASPTSLVLDSLFFSNVDMLQIGNTLAGSSINIEGVSSGNPVIVQFGTAGGAAALPKMINLVYDVSDGAILANQYKQVLSWTIPTGYTAYLIRFCSYQGETASSRMSAQQTMGTINTSTNVFTAGTAYTAPQWAGIVQGDVTTALAAGAGNVVYTVTYTNQDGTASRTGTITIAKGTAIGGRASMVLQAGDIGVRSIQNVSAAPTQVGVVRLLGILQLAQHQDQATTGQMETLYSPGAITFPTGTILSIEYSGGTVAKQRLFDALVQLVSSS